VENPADAVSVTDPPSQKAVGPPAVMVGALGSGLTVTVTGSDTSLHPEPFVTVTE